MNKKLKKGLNDLLDLLKEAAGNTAKYSVRFIGGITSVIGRLTWILGKYAVSTFFGHKEQHIQLFADLVELVYSMDDFKRNVKSEEEKNFFDKAIDKLNGLIEEYFPEESKTRFQQFKVECTQDLFKSTYKENAFTKGKAYLVLREEAGMYHVEDNLQYVFTFNNNGTREDMYQFDQYFKR